MNPLYDRLRHATRREFLRRGAAGFAAFVGAAAVPACGGPADGEPVSAGGGGTGPVSNITNLGPLQPPDVNGIRLPFGFTSRIVARSGVAPVPGGSYLWHPAPDGGAVFDGPSGGWIYVSNGESPGGAGGAGALRFDSGGNVVAAYPILAGTSRNCAGGKMPWGRYLSCEESGDASLVYDCDPLGMAAAAALPALGRFNHEAVAWDAAQGRLYLTEDQPDGGLYRFTPASLIAPGVPNLSVGTLEIARVTPPGPEGAVTWLPVPDPDGSPVTTRAQAASHTSFNRGEGIVAQGGVVYFVTTGDNRLWAYDVSYQALMILYDDSTSPTPFLTGVDNIDISADGDLLVAEDGGDMQIVALTPGGAIVPVLQVIGQSSSEVTGPAFDPSRRRLYFSSQRGTTGADIGGITYEVTGPFIA